MKIKEKQEFNNDSQLVNIENCEIEDDNEKINKIEIKFCQNYKNIL